MTISRDGCYTGETIIINMQDLYNDLGTDRGFPGAYERADKVLFVLFVSVVVLGFHDYGTSFHGNMEKTIEWLKEALNFYNIIDAPLTIDATNGDVKCNEEVTIFLLSFFFSATEQQYILREPKHTDEGRSLFLLVRTGSSSEKVVSVCALRK